MPKAARCVRLWAVVAVGLAAWAVAARARAAQAHGPVPLLVIDQGYLTHPVPACGVAPCRVVFVTPGVAARNYPSRRVREVLAAMAASGSTIALALPEGTDAPLARLATDLAAGPVRSVPDAAAWLQALPAPSSGPSSAATAVPPSPAVAAPAASLPAPVARASAYAVSFAHTAVFLLAREHYEQEVRRRAGSSSAPPDSDAGITTMRRVLDSEVALVQTGAEELWLLARDIQQVDGRPLAAKDRIPLPAVGRLSEADALQAFRRVAGQGARFNIGYISRDLNVPTLALWLFTPGLVERFRFEIEGRARVAGIDCDVLRYRESRAPYLFQVNGVPKPVQGRAWIVRDTGVILRTELRLESGRYGNSRARVVVEYGFDDRLQQWVPREMSERYDDVARQAEGFIVGKATYSDYRRFETSGRIKQP